MKNAWGSTKLFEILKPISRQATVHPMHEYRLLGIRLDGRGVFRRETKLGSQISAPTLFQVKTGDFIYSRLFAWRGAFGIISADLDGCYVSSEFPTFTPIAEKIDIDFLRLWFRLPTTIARVEVDCTGSTPLTRNRFKENFFLDMEILLPPLEEQRRIVARIEELAAKIEEVRGLRREAVGEMAGLIPSAMKVVLNHDQWPKTLLGDLLRENSLNGLSLHPSNTPRGLPILRISAATSRSDGIVDEADFKYLELNERDIAKYKVEPGDLLACRFNGNLHYVGRVALYKGYSGSLQIYPDKLIRLRVDPKKILPEFTRYVMNSPIGRRSVEAFCETTAGNIGISATDLKTVPIPVPPLPEQRRIVAYLDELQAKVDALKQVQAETQAELDALLPSILDRAFRGELV